MDRLTRMLTGLAWLGGGLWFLVREAVKNRVIQALAFAAGADGA